MIVQIVINNSSDNNSKIAVKIIIIQTTMLTKIQILNNNLDRNLLLNIVYS